MSAAAVGEQRLQRYGGGDNVIGIEGSGKNGNSAFHPLAKRGTAGGND